MPKNAINAKKNAINAKNARNSKKKLAHPRFYSLIGMGYYIF
jgi:hypothetical protein